MTSFEKDPDDSSKLLGQYESYLLRVYTDRALKWLVDRIYEANLDPIAITLNSSGDSNPDILKALDDPRYMSNPTELLTPNSRKKYLTPHFLENFDFSDTWDRNFMKSKVRFMSIMLGF
jgi:hypothetical protein